MVDGSRSVAGARIEVRAKVVPINSSARLVHHSGDGGLARQRPFRGYATAVHPHRDTRLLDRPSGELAEPLTQRDLPVGSLEEPLQAVSKEGVAHRVRDVGVHVGAENNTTGVIHANTGSVIPFPETQHMGRNGGKTSEFWIRLTEARTSRKRGPLSMVQTDIAKQYKVRQSAVTKWKTGGLKGTTKPEPELVEQMANDADCAFEYLWWGRGPMRPNVPLDPVTQQVVEAMEKLESPEHKRAVLAAALAQQQLQRPDIAARVRQAEREAERQIKNASRKTS